MGEIMAQAGSLESGDVHVSITAGAGELEIESPVIAIFGDAIRATAREVLTRYHLPSVRVKITDRGALDYVLRARLETAALRWTGAAKG